MVRHGVLYRAAHQCVGKKQGTSQNGGTHIQDPFDNLQSKQVFVWNIGAKFGITFIEPRLFAIKVERLVLLFSVSL